MAGIDTETGSTGKRRVDREINMVPFIDLLMVTISFLLITAVWSSLGRLQTSAHVPGKGAEKRPTVEPSVLMVRASPTDHTFDLRWQTGSKVEDLTTVAMTADASGRYVALERAIAQAYTVGLSTRHLAGDDLGQAGDGATLGANVAVLRVENDIPLRDITRIIEAIHTPRRLSCTGARPACCGAPTASGRSSEGCAKAAANVPAFEVSFSSS